MTSQPFRWFRPILAGANLKDRLVASLGAIVGICVTALVCTLSLGRGWETPFIVAPMGASAVLVFAVPASPLAQPWSVIGGNTISALIGVAVRMAVPDPVLATGIGVGLAIAVMSLARCLHPPGGAAALTAVLAGPAVASSGFMFALLPVGVNSVLLTLIGFGFHKLSRHSYPHRPAPTPANLHATADPAPTLRVGFQTADIDAALSDLDDTFDISREDLDRLLRQVELRALARKHGVITCAELMSRDIVSIDADASARDARRLLLAHNVRVLPVLAGGRLAGTIGLREAGGEGQVSDVMSPAATARPDAPAFGLVPVLTDGRTHAVIVVGEDRGVLGVVTQTDLLAAMSRAAAVAG